MSASGAPGWTIADVVLHLAQSEEGVKATATHRQLRTGLGAVAGDTMDERAAAAVRMERAAPAEVFARWQRARQAALAAVRAADPDQPLEWVAGPVKPATLATTRLAEHWAHGLDITGPLGIEFPDTERLRHVAWLAHRTLPYALSLAGQPPVAVRCELTAPDGRRPRRPAPGGSGRRTPGRRSPGRPATSAGSPRSGSTRPSPGCGPAARTAPPPYGCCVPTRPDPVRAGGRRVRTPGPGRRRRIRGRAREARRGRRGPGPPGPGRIRAAPASACG